LGGGVAILASLGGSAMGGIEKIAFGLFLVGTVLFFLWVAVLTLRK
jgi:hypothetical protein